MMCGNEKPGSRVGQHSTVCTKNTGHAGPHVANWSVEWPNEPEKTPADKLADEASALIDALMTSRWNTMPLANAVNAYRSTRNGAGQTVAEALGSPPDPVRVARFLLDSLTGGALSSLICAVRDEVISRWGAADLGLTDRHALDNLRANLRALGEKIP